MMDPRLQAALEKIQGELLQLLQDTVRVLEQNRIPYCLICGTLLGAVRHKGFIPWDDDVDLVMPRSSYERFAALYPSQCSQGFYLDTTDTWVPRIRRQGGGELAFVDLFILDPLPENPLQRGLKLLGLRILQGTLKEHTDYTRFSLPQRAMLLCTSLMGKPFPKAVKLRAYDRLSRLGNPASPLLHMANCSFHLLGTAFSPDIFDAPVPGDFQSLTVRLPRDASQVLTRLYGPDYMTPPPESERRPQHLTL
ncbi:MAG: LicD family protein [Clostridiales bacterium]|nr:LicD family protein [Clostridiales bacterium]